ALRQRGAVSYLCELRVAQPTAALAIVQRAQLFGGAAVRDAMVHEIFHDRACAAAPAHAIERIEHGLDRADEPGTEIRSGRRRESLLTSGVDGAYAVERVACLGCLVIIERARRVFGEACECRRRIDHAVVFEGLELAQRGEARVTAGAAELGELGARL